MAATFFGLGAWLQAELGHFGIKGQLAILFVVFFVDAVFFPMLPEAFVLYFYSIFPTIDTRFSQRTDLVLTAFTILIVVLAAEVVANYFLYTMMRRALRAPPDKRVLRPNRLAVAGLAVLAVAVALPWVSVLAGTASVNESLLDLAGAATGFAVGGARVLVEDPSAASVRLTLLLSLGSVMLGAAGVWSKRARAAAIVALGGALLMFTDLLAGQFGGKPAGTIAGSVRVSWGPSVGFLLAVAAAGLFAWSFRARYDVPMPPGTRTWWAKHNLQSRLTKAMNQWRDFLVVSDERIILVNRVVPVMPFMGAFLAVSPWSPRKAMGYLVLGGFLKYGALIAIVGAAGLVFDPGSTWKFTLVLLATILGLSAVSHVYVRRRMQRQARTMAAAADEPPPLAPPEPP